MDASLFFLLLFVYWFPVSRILTTAIHELGHALPALLLTPAPMTVYLGAYGDTTQDLTVSIGRLSFRAPRNPFRWKGGMLSAPKAWPSVAVGLAVVSGGPLFSLLQALLGGWIMLGWEASPATRLFGMVLLMSGAATFFYSIVPNKTPLYLTNGNITYNDGEQLRRLFYSFRHSKVLAEIQQDCTDGQLHSAAEKCEQLLARGRGNAYILQIAVAAHLENGDAANAVRVTDAYAARLDFRSEEFNDLGLRLALTECLPQALTCFQQAKILDPRNTTARVNHGFCLLCLGRAEEAIAEFTPLISDKIHGVYALSNRGLAQTRLGDTEAGRSDLEAALQLNDQEPYAHLNLGIFYFEKQDYARALPFFEQTQALNPDTYPLKKYLDPARNALQAGT
ncbi:MAG: tetratricopeptide repeat protein [Saprospiraceae bacterium]|nr:tetratricopeptide repeat protein [Saprospiraceae bacterium]